MRRILAVGIVLGMVGGVCAVVFSEGENPKARTQAALEKMREIGNYNVLNAGVSRLVSEVKLEYGNHLKGGYRAFRFFEIVVGPENNLRSVVKLIYCDEQETRLHELPGWAYRQLWLTLERAGIWDVRSTFETPCRDCDTAFLMVRDSEEKRDLVVYAPEVLKNKPASPYAKILAAIEEVGMPEGETETRQKP